MLYHLHPHIAPCLTLMLSVTNPATTLPHHLHLSDPSLTSQIPQRCGAGQHPHYRRDLRVGLVNAITSLQEWPWAVLTYTGRVIKSADSWVVQFSHFSVKEFLTADWLAEPIRVVSRYHIRPEVAHTILVWTCLGVLLQLDDCVDCDSMKSFLLAR
jgi:hypothetical protein